jgi:hypothetical protein
MKMADELHGKSKADGQATVNKYKGTPPAKIADLANDP